jgi:hypothetical protein
MLLYNSYIILQLSQIQIIYLKPFVWTTWRKLWGSDTSAEGRIGQEGANVDMDVYDKKKWNGLNWL